MPFENFIIRPIGPADAIKYRDLRLAGLQESPQAFCSSYEQELAISLDVLRERISEEVSEGKGVIAGAFNSSGELAGIGGLRISAGQYSAHKGTIWGIYVKPAFRRRGIARKIVENLIAFASGKPKTTRVNLSVLVPSGAAESPAFSLYERMGFEVYGREADAYSIKGTFYDEVLMGRAIA